MMIQEHYSPQNRQLDGGWEGCEGYYNCSHVRSKGLHCDNTDNAEEWVDMRDISEW